MYLVSNCFDWIGFHLTEKLLNEGKEVIGFSNIVTEKQENLALFIGRNSLLTQVTNKNELTHYLKNRKVDTVFNIDDGKKSLSNDELTTNRWVEFTTKLTEEECTSDIVNIELPLLYGEWMPRDKHGIFHLENYIPFDSDTFKESAVYVNDFIDVLWHVLSTKEISNNMEFKALKQKGRAESNQAHVIYVKEKEKMENRLNSLNEHYTNYSKLY